MKILKMQNSPLLSCKEHYLQMLVEPLTLRKREGICYFQEAEATYYVRIREQYFIGTNILEELVLR